jgi:hypothetical protein
MRGELELAKSGVGAEALTVMVTVGGSVLLMAAVASSIEVNVTSAGSGGVSTSRARPPDRRRSSRRHSRAEGRDESAVENGTIHLYVSSRSPGAILES